MTNLRAGEVLYTKKVTRRIPGLSMDFSAKRGHQQIVALLGTLDEKGPLPTMNQQILLFGGIGYIAFDDVEECLGKKAFEKLFKYYKDKYDPKDTRR